MNKILAGVAAGAMICSAGALQAQSFTYQIVWEPVDSVGGLMGPDGPQYQGGSVKGTYKTKLGDGTEYTGTVKCVGMDQPDGGIFAIHLTCTAKNETSSSNIVYGCNFLGKPGPETPLGCVGGIQGKEGPMKDRRGGVTMEWYTDADARGTGQWYGAE